MPVTCPFAIPPAASCFVRGTRSNPNRHGSFGYVSVVQVKYSLEVNKMDGAGFVPVMQQTMAAHITKLPQRLLDGGKNHFLRAPSAPVAYRR